MKKYKTFILFLILVSLWSTFFSTLKFFLWGDLKSNLGVSLQEISGFLSLGGVISYLIGGALASTFLKKYLLFTLSFLTLIFVLTGYVFGLDSKIYLGITLVFIGMFYGAWSVLKNVIISIEIKKTGLQDTKLNAFVSIIFVLSIIFGSIFGSLLFEKLNNLGFLVIIYILLFSAIISLFLDYDKLTFSSLVSNGFKNYYFERKLKISKAIKSYIPELKYVFSNYTLIIISSAFLWAISTIVSQKAVEYSQVAFSISASKSAFILLYSAFGAIFGNLFSIKMSSKRWQFFIFSNIIFAFLTIALPFFSYTYLVVSIRAFFIGFFFGISSNLIDSYFFSKLGDEDKKEYGSSTYGLILSLVIFFMMFIANFIDHNLGYKVLMLFFGIILFIISFFTYFKLLKKGN